MAKHDNTMTYILVGLGVYMLFGKQLLSSLNIGGTPVKSAVPTTGTGGINIPGVNNVTTSFTGFLSSLFGSSNNSNNSNYNTNSYNSNNSNNSNTGNSYSGYTAGGNEGYDPVTGDLIEYDSSGDPIYDDTTDTAL